MPGNQVNIRRLGLERRTQNLIQARHDTHSRDASLTKPTPAHTHRPSTPRSRVETYRPHHTHGSYTTAHQHNTTAPRSTTATITTTNNEPANPAGHHTCINCNPNPTIPPPPSPPNPPSQSLHAHLPPQPSHASTTTTTASTRVFVTIVTPASRSNRRSSNRQLVTPLILRMPGVTANPVKMNLVPLHQFIKPAPKILVLHRLLRRRPPTTPLPVRHPGPQPLKHILRVAMQMNNTPPRQALKPADHSHQLHPVVRRQPLPTSLFLHRPARRMTQHKRPPTRPRIPRTRTVRKQLNNSTTTAAPLNPTSISARLRTCHHAPANSANRPTQQQ